jgi:predicted transcriptional regulator of viral defense system
MTGNEATLLQYLSDNGLDIFTKDQLVNKSDLSEYQLEIAIRNLLKKDKIIQLERGKYYVYGFFDENTIGCFLAHNSCISYWSAMNYHGLTEQIPNTVFVQTDKQKNNKRVQGVQYQFVWLKQEKIFGYKTEGYGNHIFRISDKEKTIIDCFDKPKYSGGYAEIIKAFYNAELNVDKLIRYCRKMKNIAVTKRLGFLADFFEKKRLQKFMDYALKIKNEKYNLFEHDGTPKGHINKKWGLVMNLDTNEIKNMATG